MILATVASNTIHATRCRVVTRIPCVRQLATTDREIHGSRVVRDKNGGNRLWTCMYAQEYHQCDQRDDSTRQGHLKSRMQ